MIGLQCIKIKFTPSIHLTTPETSVPAIMMLSNGKDIFRSAAGIMSSVAGCDRRIMPSLQKEAVEIFYYGHGAQWLQRALLHGAEVRVHAENADNGNEVSRVSEFGRKATGRKV